MKYLVLIIDGASGWPVPAWGGRTSLEAACTPNLDRLAREGRVGLVYNVPSGMEPSSAVACMSVIGFDPKMYYGGRGPIEAMAMGIELEPGQVAMRCNFVTVLEGRLVSYSAGDITTEEAAELVAALRRGMADLFQDDEGRTRLDLYPGVGFRCILTVRDGGDLLATSFTAPHDITDREVAEFAPIGPGARLVEELMERSRQILAGHPVNVARMAKGQLPATQIWLFWPGMRPAKMPAFADIHQGRKGALTSAVDVLRGLAVQTGMDLLDIPGVTDGPDNDFQGQMKGALAALEGYDVVFVHVEAPDTAAHAGQAEQKVWAIEQIDGQMITQALQWKPGCLSLLVLPDHPTPLAIKTHVAEPVPFVMWGPGFVPNGARAFSEAEARSTGLTVAPGHLLMSQFLGC